jgi:hypothetical protein
MAAGAPEVWFRGIYPSSPPIGRASNIKVEGDRLMGDIEFASADVYPFADQIFRLVREKFITAVSE